MARRRKVMDSTAKAEAVPGYARELASGWDYWAEAHNVVIRDEATADLERLKRQAVERDARGGDAVTVNVNGVVLQVQPYAMQGGKRYVLANDDMIVGVGSAAADWAVSVRFLSAGLWEHGVPALREVAAQVLHWIGDYRDGPRAVVSRADWCVDLYSPAFTQDARNPELKTWLLAGPRRKVAEKWTPEPEGSDPVKVTTYGRAARYETLQVGSLKTLQVSFYDKCREITEASGKTWLYNVWSEAADFPADFDWDHVWRIEARWNGDWLKDRSATDPEELLLPTTLAQLWTESLQSISLRAPNGDPNRSRWPLHPLWRQALSLRADALRPLGRIISPDRARALADGLERQMAGALRTLAYLRQIGGGDAASDVATMQERIARLHNDDPHAEGKRQRVRDRYRFVTEAR